VLEHLPGGTLADLLHDGRPVADDDAARITAEIASGLAHAHARGLVHRDLKPANILFDGEGRAKIADFGIARMGAAATLTEAGTVLGTPAYLSPEQAAGEPATPASDVYSLGAIVYQLLVGRPPFEADDPLQLLVKHRTEAPTPPSQLRAGVPPDLEHVAMASLAKDPAERPEDGEAVLALLGRRAAAAPLRPSETATAVIVGPPPSPRRGGFRRGAVAAAAAVLAAAGIGLALLTTRGEGQPGEATTPATAPSTRTGTTSTSEGTTESRPPTTAGTPATTTQPSTDPATQPSTTAPAPETTTPGPTTPDVTTAPEPPTVSEPTTTAP
jgi:serine/threonine-protein kinase